MLEFCLDAGFRDDVIENNVEQDLRDPLELVLSCVFGEHHHQLVGDLLDVRGRNLVQDFEHLTVKPVEKWVNFCHEVWVGFQVLYFPGQVTWDLLVTFGRRDVWELELVLLGLLRDFDKLRGAVSEHVDVEFN